jgi:hypothetical protein
MYIFKKLSLESKLENDRFLQHVKELALYFANLKGLEKELLFEILRRDMKGKSSEVKH